MAIIAYIRVSTVEQNTERQHVIIEKYNVEKVFEEKASAKNTDRPQLQALLDYVRDGDTVVIKDFSRLARSTMDLLSIVNQLEEMGVKLVSDKEQLDTATANGKLMLTMLGAINEFERANLLERQAEGIEIAKKREGGYHKTSRKSKSVSNFPHHYDRWANKLVSKMDLAKELNISRTTLDKLIKDEQAKRMANMKGGV